MLFNELRYAFRQLRKSPAFTITVLLTLALCVGANTAIYSVVDAVLFRSLPYPDPSRLAMLGISWRYQGRQGLETRQTGEMFEVARAQAPSLDVAAYRGADGVNFSHGQTPEYIQQQRVSTGFFRVLGVKPQRGREFLASEDISGGTPVAVLSYPFWQRAFGGDFRVLGQHITLRGEPYTVVGIMPQGFRTETAVDVWTPLKPSRTGEGGGTNYAVIARLRPTATWAQAFTELKVLSRNIQHSNMPREVAFEESAVPLQRGATIELRSGLLLTWAAALVVLLIGCVNIAGLLLARASERRREIATRMAMGGTRRAIIRQLLLESILLAAGGGICGLFVGNMALDILKRLGAKNMELWHPLILDARVLGTMLLIALFTSVLFGLLPALEASRVDIRSVLVEGGRSVAGSRQRWLRNGLVISEVALSMVLLVSAGLLVKTLAYLDNLNPGFDPHHLLTAQTSLQDARYATGDRVTNLFNKGLERIRAIPGVQSAAVALTLPFERPLNDVFQLAEAGDKQGHITDVVYQTPGYLELVKIPLLAGRTIRDSDTAGNGKIVVVSLSFAQRYFHNQEALGQHLNMGQFAYEIVGIVGDVQQHSGIGDFGPLSVEPTVYVPVAQIGDRSLQMIHTFSTPRWVVRTQRPAGQLASEIQKAVAAVDPQLPVAEFRTIEQLHEQAVQDQLYHATLFMSIAGLASLLAAVGLYGLIAHSVAQRTREMGIRMALGATVRHVITTTTKPGIVFALCGIGIGLVLAAASSSLLKHLIWGVQPLDLLTFAVTSALLLCVALLATLLPALRLLRLDPAQTLRDQ